MANFYAGQTDYIEKLNQLATANELVGISTGLANLDNSVTAAANSAVTALAAQTTATAAASTATTQAAAALVSSANALLSETTALAAQTAAGNAVISATAQANAAELSAITASAAASAASVSASNANLSSITAGLSATTALAAQTAAGLSATTASTKASNAELSATTALAAQTAAGLSATTASTQATNASNSAIKASQWADNNQNVEVETGRYSAKHWAMVAQATLTGALVYMGGWSATGGTYPTNPVIGYFYKITAAGTISGTQYDVNDSIIYNGTTWDKIDNTEQSIPIASAGTLGLVRVGSGLSIDGSGILSAAGATDLAEGVLTTTNVVVTSSTGADATLSPASTTTAGVMTSADKTKLNGIATGANNYSLPIASAGTLGGVKIGSGISIDGSGTISATGATNLAQGTANTTAVPITSSTGTAATLTSATTLVAGVMSSTDKVKLDGLSNYTLPTASAGTLGGVKIGSGLNIDGSGVVSLSASEGYSGTVTLDFGIAPGGNISIATVLTSAINSNSQVDAWLMGVDGPDHNAYEHMIVPMTIRAGNITPGVGFEIIASSELRLTGRFACQWVHTQ